MVVKITSYNQTYIKVDGDAGFLKNLQQSFRFRVPGYVHMPAYKAGYWDGFIYLYNLKNKLIYAGLFDKVVKFAELQGEEVETSIQTDPFPFSDHEAGAFIDLLKLPHQVRDYQLKAFMDCVRKPRQLILMPTGSGKSLSIYLLTRYFDKKTLIIVPTLNLVHQMTNDFASYGYKKDIHCIFSGKEKMTDAKIVISTWQSIYKLKEEFFNQFNMVVVDECHLAKSKSITSIMEKMVSCPIRFGFTGTLDGAMTNSVVLEGLFGPINKVTSSSKLIDQGHLSSFKINCIIFKYKDEERALCKDLSYQEEVDWIVTHSRRNKFIEKLTLSLKENTLVLFQFVEKQGLVLHKQIMEATDRPVHLIHGAVDGEEREQIRQIVQTQNNAIILGSNQTVSTGINIPNLHNIIFTSPTKSRVRTLQSIGRVLRTSENKDQAVLYDLVDDLSHKRHRNYTLKHFIHRVEIYGEEKFPFKTYNVQL